jgi:phosphoribosylanthranilate isomerase
MMVKICGITCREDALAAVEAGASALGFNFYRPSPRYITPDKAARLAGILPSGVLRVGVFVNEPKEVIAAIVEAVPLDVVQLHGDCGKPAGVRVWKAQSVGEDFDPLELQRYEADAFLLDAPAGTQYGGTGRTFDWSRVSGLRQRIVLAGGLGPDNVAEAIAAVKPWGVDACSRLESAPGKKDPVKMREFVRQAVWREI